MRMRNFVLAMVAFMSLMIAPAALAQTTVDVSGLSAEQIAEVNAKATELKNKTPEELRNTRETLQNINQYVEIGKGVGIGLGTAAKELNVAVNDFAKTPVGQITMGLIIFKVAGPKIIGVASGIIWFSVILPFWWIMFNKLGNPKTVEIDYDSATGKRVAKRVIPADPDNGNIAFWRGFMFFMFFVICGAGFFMLF